MRKLNKIQIVQETAGAKEAGLVPAALPETEEKSAFPVFKRVSEWMGRIRLKPFPWKKINAKNALIASCLVLVAVAGFLNIRYGLRENGETASPVSSEKPAAEEKKTEADFFAAAVIDRERVRDEAMEVLVNITEDESADDTARADAYSALERIAYETSCEIDIENLVKAKGFTECVAVVSGEEANIVVKSDGLTAGEIAQIKEIVYLEAKILPKNIKIIERNG